MLVGQDARPTPLILIHRYSPGNSPEHGFSFRIAMSDGLMRTNYRLGLVVPELAFAKHASTCGHGAHFYHSHATLPSSRYLSTFGPFLVGGVVACYVHRHSNLTISLIVPFTINGSPDSFWTRSTTSSNAFQPFRLSIDDICHTCVCTYKIGQEIICNMDSGTGNVDLCRIQWTHYSGSVSRYGTAHQSCFAREYCICFQGRMLLVLKAEANMDQLFYIVQILYLLTNMAVKLSISYMLLDIVVEESHKKVIYIVSVLMQVCIVVWCFLIAFPCTPVQFYWTRFEGQTNGKCLAFRVTGISTYIYTTLCVLFDLVMVILPWFVVRKMQQTLRTRLMIAFLLGVGSV